MIYASRFDVLLELLCKKQWQWMEQFAASHRTDTSRPVMTPEDTIDLPARVVVKMPGN
jgi:hypothetical protein